MFHNAFVFTCKAFTFPKETLHSLAQFLCCLKVNAKYLGGTENFCKRMSLLGLCSDQILLCSA